MVPGASLDMTLSAPNAAVDIMMLHPKEGPWWPARATSDATGRVHLDAVPAGMFTIRIKAQPGGAAELENVKLDPGGAADLGPVPLSQ
ncbi:MAG: carboxypeptidase-like regulatory domain-containing protein [Candidatus Hydrogenedentes bacterium]|nr:carboxypeptidase-like regulatory domain-containing protein [Candidatus Hydrogenedentota bacterium]